MNLVLHDAKKYSNQMYVSIINYLFLELPFQAALILLKEVPTKVV